MKFYSCSMKKKIPKISLLKCPLWLVRFQYTVKNKKSLRILHCMT